MNLQEIIKKYLDDDSKVAELLEEMKTNKIYTASEENLDTRYSKLKGDFDAKSKEHEEATKLIEQLKSSSKGNEDLQGKITEYETKNAELQKELEQTKIDSALKVALANAKVTDVDYVAFKVKEKGELKLDDKGNLKGIDDTLKDVKTAYPTFFESEKKKEIDVKEIGKGDTGREPEPTNLTEALSQKYAAAKNEL